MSSAPPRPELPIDAHLGEIVRRLGTDPALVLVAPPGAGKTTRLPPALLDAPWMEGKTCLVLEPRRIAARAAARRAAEETGGEPGGRVGYHVRSERRFGKQTRLLYCTEGILTARLQSDPFLEGVGAVVFDEFHERSLDADLCLGMVAEIRASARPDLRVAVCSATLDPGPVAAFLGAWELAVPGRLHPVEIEYLDAPPPEHIDAAAARGVRRAFAKRPSGSGDVLVFLPGAEEIRRTARALEAWAVSAGAALLPLHGEMPPEAQDAALRPSDTPRVLLATNVAETSLTIPGVTAVVDAGLVRLSEFDPAAGLTRLVTARASRASAEQRSGRAGRLGPGYALRLWTRHDDLSRPERIAPEVHRADLARSVLELSAWGHRDPSAFRWFDPPKPERLEAASALLRALDAVDRAGNVTPAGKQMLRVPLHPRLGRLFLDAAAKGLAAEAAAVAAVAEERDILLSGRAFSGASAPAGAHRSDLLHRAELLGEAERLGFDSHACRALGVDASAARMAARERGRLLDAARSFRSGRHPGSEEERERELLRLIFRAFPDRLARAAEGERPGRYVLAGGRGAVLSDRSVVANEPLVTAVRLDAGKRGPRAEAILQWASAVDQAWLRETGRVTEEVVTWFDEERERVAAARVSRFDGLELAKTPSHPDREEAARLLAARALADPPAALKPDGRAQTLLRRMAFLTRHLGPERFPAWGEEEWRGLLEGLCRGQNSFEGLRRADLFREILSRLPHASRRLLETEAPERLRTPAGSEIRLDYPDEGPPVLAAKMQEMFGLADVPRVAAGRVAVLLHLLGPHGRPLQVTSDLRSFWENGYPEVRKEMRGRYPKHYWPEDPVAAAPTRKTTKKPSG